jgi:hypothetical protein
MNMTIEDILDKMKRRGDSQNSIDEYYFGRLEDFRKSKKSGNPMPYDIVALSRTKIEIPGFVEWEGDVIRAVEDLMEATTSDAQGIIEAQEMQNPTLLLTYHRKGTTPEQMAKIIDVMSRVNKSPRYDVIFTQHGKRVTLAKGNLSEEDARKFVDMMNGGLQTKATLEGFMYEAIPHVMPGDSKTIYTIYNRYQEIIKKEPDFLKAKKLADEFDYVIEDEKGEVVYPPSEVEHIKMARHYQQKSSNPGTDSGLTARGGTRIPSSVRKFMPRMQQRIVESSPEFVDIVRRLEQIIDSMPVTYQTEGTPADEKIIYLHYFYGNSDWYIAEKDVSGEQLQAYGYTILNGDTQNAEWGYISIKEISDTNKVELDFHWRPRKFSEVMKEIRASSERQRTKSMQPSYPLELVNAATSTDDLFRVREELRKKFIDGKLTLTEWEQVDRAVEKKKEVLR